MGADVPVPGASMSVAEMREMDERMRVFLAEMDAEAGEDESKSKEVSGEQNGKSEAAEVEDSKPTFSTGQDLLDYQA